MPRQNHSIEGLIPGKIRKRGCSSPASSSSSVIQNYRFKRAILVGKRGGSSTPVPTWRLMGTRSPAVSVRGTESPRYTPSQCGSKVKQAPVSARKLAATLWEMNELPSPRLKEGSDERRKMKKDARGREKVGGSVRSGSLPPHLSDPSHSPFSERMDRSETGSRRRRTQSVSNKLKHMDNNIGVLDSISSASLMEVETRSQVQTPSGSNVGAKTRLKDVSNALTTSKELLKIINRMWGHEDHPSSSMSLISALHAELERARLQVNHIIQEQRSDRNEINYLMKCFAEEKAAWKSKEHEVVEAAIESVAGELEVERKLRRRFESLNKKLGRELAETKTSLTKMVKELESEKRTREIMEQVCNELARDVGEDKAEVLELKRESAKVLEEVEKEREMMQLADVLREERVQMKLSEAKHQLEEKNAAVEKLRSQLEVFLGTKKLKQKGRASASYRRDDKIAAYLSNAQFGSHKRGEHDDDGEVEDRVDCEEESGESDLHSIELNMDDNNKSCKLAYAPRISQDSRRSSVDEIDLTKRDSVTSSGNLSLRSSVSTDTGVNRETKNDPNSFAPSQGSRDGYETGTQSMSSFSSPTHVHESVTLSPLPNARGFSHPGANAPIAGLVTSRPLTSKSTYTNFDNAMHHDKIGSDERITQRVIASDPLLFSAPATYFKRTSVVWDQEAGRYVSVPLSSSEARNRSSMRVELPSSTTEPTNSSRRPIQQEASSSRTRGSIQQADTLMYTGDSIFFGGPLLNLPGKGGVRNDMSSSSNEGQEKVLNIPRDSRLKRDLTSNQQPIFVPGGAEHNHPSGSGSK